MGFWEAKSRGMSRNAVTPIRQPQKPTFDRSTPASVPFHAPQPETTMCPDCGSNNYGGAKGSKHLRCFDCGFSPGNQYRNSTQGDPGMASTEGGAPTPAKQVDSGGYNPQNIIGRVN